VPFATCIVRMSLMHKVHLRNLDLNLLVLLHALLEERHITGGGTKFPESIGNEPGTGEASRDVSEIPCWFAVAVPTSARFAEKRVLRELEHSCSA